MEKRGEEKQRQAVDSNCREFCESYWTIYILEHVGVDVAATGWKVQLSVHDLWPLASQIESPFSDNRFFPLL